MIRYIRRDMKLDIKLLKVLFAAALAGFISVSAAQAAGLFAPDPCDPEYYESLKSRAWLEAQREITQNQNLIFKADSVLEYTCFDGYLKELADHAGPPVAAGKMFTGTNRWGGVPGNMSTTLSRLVAAPMDAYDTANFNHTLLGGRTGSGVNLPASISPGNYTCNVMDQVWKQAKCMDFIHTAAEDGFFTFDQYHAQADKRFLPTRCPKTANFKAEQDKAIETATTPWTEDDVITYFGLIFPSGGCGSANGQFASKIKTGLVIERTSGGVSKYNEYVCVVPGCYYEPTGQNSGSCKN
ncbi:MAG: hypothetical protein H6859_04680 [Rhodospirillales bacterium]|nr:hypothetical protein [Alphaproteobacteria bacterium]USO06478.1 MAG: hypothetical protein H6859_04680 [Rhodospirillales bacterium]